MDKLSQLVSIAEQLLNLLDSLVNFKLIKLINVGNINE